MRRLMIVAVAALLATSSWASGPVRIIFDTDMGNDVDDVIALDMLYKYADMGKVDILGVVSSKREEGSIRFIDAMNVLYGYPDTPVGIVRTYPGEDYECKDRRLNYADYVMEHNEYPHAIDDYSRVPDGYKLFRKLLAESKDKVTIVAVGFSTNLARLLSSTADEFSKLNGIELVERKVDRLVMMAGNMHVEKKEYNVYKDQESAVRVAELWPTDILYSDFELGRSVFYSFVSAENDFRYVENHPAYKAYCYYGTMPYNRPMWDATAVLFAVEPDERYYTLSQPGEVVINQGSITFFYPSGTGRRRYYESTPEQKLLIMKRIAELTAMKPRSVR